MFKLNIIQKQLEGKITIHFTPTFINHMVNEVEEYITVLEFLKKGKFRLFFMNCTIISFG